MEPLSLPGTPTTDDERNGQRPGTARPRAEPAAAPATAWSSWNGQRPARRQPKLRAAGRAPARPAATTSPRRAATAARLALFCYEAPDSPVGQHVAQLVAGPGPPRHDVHLFTRLPFASTAGRDGPRGRPRQTSGRPAGSSVEEFTRPRPANAFLQQFPRDARPGPARPGVVHAARLAAAAPAHRPRLPSCRCTRWSGSAAT